MGDLRECPFCGGNAAHKLIEAYSLDSSYYAISCDSCQCVMYASEKISEQDIKDWNSRVNEDLLKDALGWAIPALERYVDVLGLEVDGSALEALYKCKDAVEKLYGVRKQKESER